MHYKKIAIYFLFYFTLTAHAQIYDLDSLLQLVKLPIESDSMAIKANTDFAKATKCEFSRISTKTSK